MTNRTFERQLQAYDHLLRLRYGATRDEWRIERKILHGMPMMPNMFVDPDDYQCAVDGYCLIIRIPLQIDALYSPTLGGTVYHYGRGLDQRVFYTLWSGDMHRQGGAQAVADRMDNEYDARLAAKRATWTDTMEQMMKDRWTSWNTSYKGAPVGRHDFRGPGEIVW